MEKAHILQTLEQCGWNSSQAADLLGIGRTTLWRKLKEYQNRGPLNCTHYNRRQQTYTDLSTAQPNAGAHLPPEAGARHEQRLEAVRCSAVFGPESAWQAKYPHLISVFVPLEWPHAQYRRTVTWQRQRCLRSPESGCLEALLLKHT